MAVSVSELASATLLLSISGAVILVWALIWSRQSRLHMLPYPPGPTPGAIFGNINDISTPYVWQKYKEWTNKYGNIIYLQNFRQPVIIINAMEDAVELLDRRSRIYSSRPVVAMYSLMGFTAGTAMRPYGEEWRRHRKIFQQTFKPDSSLAYRPIQTSKIYEMLHRFLHTPEDFDAHIKTLAGAIILSVMYGYNVAPKDDHYVELVESTRAAFAHGSSPKWLVNNFPVLRHIPSWLPGGGFKLYASSVKSKIVEAREAPFKYATNSSFTSGTAHTPIVCSLLDSCHSPMDIKTLQEAAATGYGAGVGTTLSTIMVFMIAMITFPEVQKKAQEEIDRVFGGERLPEYGDQPSLPYVQAVVREVLRWKPIVPLGLPHASEEDDVYNGYYIPKGSIIHPNVWAITRDAAKYKDPETFNPERFFTEKGELNDDDMTYAFGFGRRICPGRHLGTATVWLAAATVLASFDIGHKKDASGNDIPLDVKYTDGLSSYPLAFKCSITPRSEGAKQLILDACDKP